MAVEKIYFYNSLKNNADSVDAKKYYKMLSECLKNNKKYKSPVNVVNSNKESVGKINMDPDTCVPGWTGIIFELDEPLDDNLFKKRGVSEFLLTKEIEKDDVKITVLDSIFI